MKVSRTISDRRLGFLLLLKEVVEKQDSRYGRVFDILIQLLVVVSLITFSLATLPGLSAETKEVLNVVEVFTVTFFTVEYLLRVLVADNKLKFIFSFYGLIDFFAILPFYVTPGLDLRSLRGFRLLRLFRLLKLIRYNKAIQRFSHALQIVKEEIVLYLAFSCLVLFFAAVGIYYFENQAQPEVFASIFHSLWWAVATLTTVGYGDIYPVTVGGKIFTFFILMIGLGIVAVPTGLLSSALSKAREMEDKKEKEE